MQNNAIYNTRIFKMNAVNFLTTFIFRYAWIWLLALSLIGVTGIALGIIIDLRWFIIGLMAIFIVFPMIFAFLYYYYGLKRECYVNTVDHSLGFCENGIEVRIYFKGEGKKTSDNQNMEVADQKEKIDEREYRSEFFPYEDMLPFVINSKSVIIPFASPIKGFLWLPADSFSDEEELAEALRFIDNKTPYLQKC